MNKSTPLAFAKFSTFAAAEAEANRLYIAYRATGDELAQFPKGPMGLTPDHVKASAAYQAALAASNQAHRDLRAFNEWFVVAFKRERNEARSARLAAGPAAPAGAH